MNRRGFFKLLGVGAAGALLPSIVLADLETPPSGGILVGEIHENLSAYLELPGEPCWLWIAVTMHPKKPTQMWEYSRLISTDTGERPEECVLDFYRKDALAAFRRAFAGDKSTDFSADQAG